jgi:hypothetical protein
VVKLEVNVEGRGGAFADRLRGCRIVDAKDGEMLIEVVDNGMQSGAPSVAIMMLTGGQAVIAQTSLKLFQVAAAATLEKYGDLTGGALTGFLDTASGTADIQFSEAVKCLHCGREIPGDYTYCPHCGTILPRAL